jgi:hypothetical protein
VRQRARPRRNRQNAAVRAMVRENIVTPKYARDTHIITHFHLRLNLQLHLHHHVDPYVDYVDCWLCTVMIL